MAKEMVCTSCHTKAQPKKLTPGSFLIELFLWLCFLVPGFVYSLWRISSKKDTCRECGSLDLVPPNSPRAKAILGDLHEIQA